MLILCHADVFLPPLDAACFMLAAKICAPLFTPLRVITHECRFSYAFDAAACFAEADCYTPPCLQRRFATLSESHAATCAVIATRRLIQRLRHAAAAAAPMPITPLPF